MTEEKVRCIQCDALILPATAAKTGGHCMPCKNGTRQSLEASRAFYEEQKAYRQSPEYRHWAWLVEQVHQGEGGMDALCPYDRMYYAVNELSREVFNGGFDQYFHNTAGGRYAEAVDGLISMGASQTLALLDAAKKEVFGDLEVPRDQSIRCDTMRSRGEDAWLIISARLDEIDTQFHADVHARDLSDLIDRYAIMHHLREGF